MEDCGAEVSRSGREARSFFGGIMRGMDKLTVEQMRKLDRLLALCCSVGHGEVTIRVKDGVIRFVGLSVEEPLELHGTQSRIVQAALQTGAGDGRK